MQAVVVEEPWWIDRFTGKIDFRQLCIEPGILDDTCSGHVIRMGVRCELGEEDLGLMQSNDRSDLVARGNRVLQSAVRKVEGGAPHAQDLRRAGRLPCPSVRISERCRFAVGEVKQQHIMSLLSKLRDGAAHADLLVVWMGSDNENVHAQLSLPRPALRRFRQAAYDRPSR